MAATPADPVTSIQDLAPPETLDPIIERIRDAKTILLIGHVRPDGDCIGSLLAMHHLLDNWRIRHAIAARDLSPGGYDVLPGFELIQPAPAPNFNPDLIVSLDCADLDRAPEGWRPTTPIVNIDHHASNTRYGVLQWIEPRCAAVGEMVYYLVLRAGVEITAPMAEALLIALTTDTGSFRFSNTTARQHEVAARLIDAGADPARVARIAYGSQSLAGAQLTGRMLGAIRLELGGRLAWSEIREETYAALGGESAAPENLSDALRSIRGVEVGVLFHETLAGGIRVNFRSDGDRDVSRVAAEFGGGGHAAAAGATIDDADYESTRDRVLERARALLI